MSVCPNIKDPQWEALVAKVGEFEAYRHWLANDRELVDISNIEISKDAKVINALQKKFKDIGATVTIEVNPHMDKTATVIKRGEREVVLQINPSAINDPIEPITHEFGHVYIDMLGGMQNPRIRASRSRLEGSALEAEIRDRYPDKSGESFDKEVLATALGRAGYKFWPDAQQNSGVLNAIRAIIRDIANLLGISRTTAEDLAREMLSGVMSKYETSSGKIVEYSYDMRKKMSKEEELIDEAIGVLTTQIAVLGNNIENESKAAQKSFDRLQELLLKLHENVSDQAMLEFFSRAETQMDLTAKTLPKYRKEFEEGVEPDEILKKLGFLNNFIRSFDVGLLRGMRDVIIQKYPEKADILSNVIRLKGDIEAEFTTLVKDVLMAKINPNFESVDAWFKREAEIAYNKSNPKLRYSEEEKKEKAAFIEKYLQDSTDKIIEEKNHRKDRMLSWVEKDINIADAFVNNPKDTNNVIIGEVDKLLSLAEMAIQQDSMTVVKIADAVYQNYIDTFGKFSNPLEQWAPFLQLDVEGNFTGELIAERSAKEREILDGKYKGTAVEDMYNFLIQTIEKRDSNLKAKHRLGRTLPSINKNIFESSIGTDFFATMKARIGDALIRRKEETEFGGDERVTPEITLNPVEMFDRTISVLVGKDNKERKFVPVNFRGQMDPQDKSADVLSSILLDYHQSVNYKHKSALSHTVELLSDIVQDIKVEQRHGLLNLLKIRAGSKQSPATISGEASNFYKVFTSMVDSRLYGILSAGSPEAHKIARLAKAWSSNVNLIGNYFSAGANLVQGSAMNWVEASAGKHYGPKNLLNAHIKRDKDIGNILVDVTRRRKLSKTELIKEFFDVENNWVPLQSRYAANNLLKRKANVGTAHTINTMAEHSVQTVSMYAVLDNIKVKNKDGKYIDKDGNVVEDRDKAMSIDDAMEVGFVHKKSQTTISKDDHQKLSESEQKNYAYGVLHLDPRVASTDRTSDATSVESITKISEVLRKVSRDLYGNYSPKNKASIERYAMGTLVTHMRKWFVPAVKRRFRGGSTLFRRDGQKLTDLAIVRNDELNELNMYYDRYSEEYSEGMYISSVRFILSQASDMVKMKSFMLTENWAKLSDAEKQNIHRTVTELAIAAFAYVTFLFLSGAMEDDDDEMIALGTFYSRRLFGELTTFINPAELGRTLRTPAVSLSLLQTSSSALFQLFSPFEEIEGGKNDGDNKLLNKMFKLIPGQAAFKDTQDLINFYSNPR